MLLGQNYSRNNDGYPADISSVFAAVGRYCCEMGHLKTKLSVYTAVKAESM